jgi:PadR family transcriptional regulator, regulatory protein PadR
VRTQTVKQTDADCPCSGRNLDKFIQPVVLAVLAGGPMHGYRIEQRLSELPLFAGQAPDITGVYRFLNLMESRGLVVSAWDAPRAGPARKSYQLTAPGRDCLGRWRATLDEYRRQVCQVLDLLQAATSEPAPAGGACCPKAPRRRRPKPRRI